MSTALNLMTVEEPCPGPRARRDVELHDGVPVMISTAEPVMMAPERALHIRTKFSAGGFEVAVEAMLPPV